MNILVCVAVAPDTTTKITFKDDNTQFNPDKVQFVINPLDEVSLTRALEIKEAKGEGKITVINVGKADAEPLIRKAFAIGADEGIRIDAEPTDAYFVAAQIAHYSKEGDYDFIFTGRETTDYNGFQVGGMIAELLGIPFICGIAKFDLDGETASMEREIEGGRELLTVKTPFVASAHEALAEPRIPSMRGIMSARTKPLNVVQPIEADMFSKIKVFEMPPPKGECKYVDEENPEELIDLLHNEAKLI